MIEGSPWPSDDHWAFVGDPMDGFTPELARLECANRWPGVDPDTLEVEFNTDFDAMLAEIDRQHAPAAPEDQQPDVDIDVNFLLAQADALREMAAGLVKPGARELEQALEEPSVGDAIVRASEDEG